MKLTIDVILQDKSFDKMRARITIEQPELHFITVSNTVDTVVSGLISKAIYEKIPPLMLDDREQLGLPFEA
jgi:hypothetical protein